MGEWCLHASSFIFDWIIIKVAGNQDMHKSLVDFGPNQTTLLELPALEWRKFHTFELEHLWSQLANLDQILCSIIGVGERLHKVLEQIDLGTLDWGERLLPFGLLVLFNIFSNRNSGYQLLDVVLFDLITTTECYYWTFLYTFVIPKFIKPAKIIKRIL